MRDPTPLPTSLSRDGRRRREQILRLAQHAAMRRGRHRRQARRAAGLIVLLVMAIGVGVGVGVRPRHGAPMHQARTNSHHQPSPAAPKDSIIPPPVAPAVTAVAPARRAPREVVIARIQTEAGLTDRLSVRADPTDCQRLSDDDLLRRLSDVGKPAGLAYVDGRAMLLFHEESREGGRTSLPVARHWRAAGPSNNRHVPNGQPF